MVDVTRLIKGIPIIINGVDEHGHRVGGQLAQLVATLERLPRRHLEHVPPITVGNRPLEGGGGYALPGQYAGSPYGFIRLNYDVFDGGQRSWNIGRINVSLLHEVGHVIDAAFECTSQMAAADRRILHDLDYRGRTHGPGEHFAQAYSKFYSEPPTITAERREVLLRSPAFAGMTWSE